jgi:hypothetical protein
MVGEAWELATAVDLACPEVAGERPPGLAEGHAYLTALRRLADEDPDVHRLTFEVLQMLKPATVLLEPELAARVNAGAEKLPLDAG